MAIPAQKNWPVAISHENRKWSNMPKIVNISGDIPKEARKVTMGSMRLAERALNWSVSVFFSG
jgi:hypothetical protein